MAEPTVVTPEVAEALERGYTLPWRWYVDPEILRLEQERIFARSWQYAGRTDQVARPGDYFTCNAGDVPIVVVRDQAGGLKAFLNVCRHRGSELVSGAGSRETLQCRYHAWTYGLDGALRAAPRSDREPAFEADELSLYPARVDTWGPFVFVNPDPEAGPLADTLRELPEIVARTGIDLDALVFHSRVEYELEANWKIAVENFLECYHCPVAHRGFSDVVDVDPDAYTLEAHATFGTQYAPLRANPPSTPYDPRGEVERGQFHLLWPNVKLNVMPGRTNLSIGPLLPAGPERTIGYLDYFFAEDTDERWVQEFFGFDNQVGHEDRALVESVQRGVRSGLVERGRLLMSSEHLIHGFQQYVLRALS